MKLRTKSVVERVWNRWFGDGEKKGVELSISFEV